MAIIRYDLAKAAPTAWSSQPAAVHDHGSNVSLHFVKIAIRSAEGPRPQMLDQHGASSGEALPLAVRTVVQLDHAANF